ncbi:MAG: hypothetical protein ACM3S1_07520 [Hyphomicrobiales bacterium]
MAQEHSARDAATRDRREMDDRARAAAPDERRRGEMEDRTRDAELPRSFDERPMELFSGEDSEGLRGEWETIQQRFVDSPREAVADADRLVSDVMQRMSSRFLAARRHLEDQWSRGEDASTEDLRQAMQRYRAFFRRLLSV